MKPTAGKLKGFCGFVECWDVIRSDLLYWSSPFALCGKVHEHLAAAGLERFAGQLEQLPPGSVLVYSTPDLIFTDRVDQSSVAAGYELLRLHGSAHRLISDWRLLGLDPEAIAGWARGEHACPSASGTPPGMWDPVQGLILRSLIELTPELLDGYLDLELQAELAHSPADTNYAQRLLPSQLVDQVLNVWWSHQDQLHQVHAALEQSRQEVAAGAEQLAERQQQLEEHQARLLSLE
ncbi:hypothetical protein KBY97_14385, partial [Synechococcus sp. ATX 2A4]|uniref:hypothetical protein n=1 Tax=Synechococcus sp. ATX 2A4 TaxID=2823727 RepID=UPI0020CD4F46